MSSEELNLAFASSLSEKDTESYLKLLEAVVLPKS